MRTRRRPDPVSSPRDLEALAAHVALGEYDRRRMRQTFRDRIGTRPS
ncbi:hypothetical protein [Natrinema soli]|uniref:Uncharacterized protein n=1 Tax=Natrinema soli TaxID=1930624 RepID=A0ABD5SRV3_9EURY|nr:hypothetical protein [Natrinema soli]